VIDCRDLQVAEVEPVAGTARVGSGLAWKQFDAVTQALGLAVTGGRVSSTGVTGLAIGSGSGWLERAMGLTSDSLIGARLVTADGLSVDTDEDPELLWALRGRRQFRGAGRAAFPAAASRPDDVGRQTLLCDRPRRRGARRVSECDDARPKGVMWRSGVPDRATRALGSRANPGAPVVAIIVLWAGDPAGGRAAMAALDALGESVVDHIGEIDYADLQQIMDPGAPGGHRDYFKGGFTRTLSDDAVADIADLGRDMRAPLTQIICAPLGAHIAYAAVDETHSAIGHRDEEWSFQVLSLWADPAQDAEQKA
jgi:hypothetical protein